MKDLNMRLHFVCFSYAAMSATIGMCLGIWMGVSGDHTLGPIHAHLNVIGWLSMAVFGLYYRGAGRPATRLDRAQVTCAAIGVPAFTGGLAIYLSTTSAVVEKIVFPIGLAGTFLCLGSMILFVTVILRDGLTAAPALTSQEV
jgi:hypothetical protein